METRTLRATLHSGTTTAGNGTAATNPTGGGLILGTLSGSGAITASVVVEISAAGSVWVPLREPERINGAGSVPVQIYYSTTAAQVRLRVVDITGTLSVGLYAVGPEISTDLKPSPDGTLVSTDPIVAPNLARSKSRGLWMPGPAARATTASTSGFATQCIFKAPHRFNRVRLAFGSVAGGAAYNVTKLVVAATNTADSMIPSVGETVTENPTTGLVTGIPSPLAVASNASTLVSKVYTPWINIPAIEAADGSFYFLARYEFSGVGPTYISGESGGWAKDGTGNYWRTKRLAAAGKNYCGADSAEFGALADAAAYQTFSHIVEAQFGGCEDGQISVAAFGASTMTAGGDNYGSFIEAANGLAFSRKLGMSFVDVAYPGITTSAIYDHLVLRGVGGEYDVLLMPVFSSNDGFTDGLVKLQLMRAFSIREQAAAYGQKVLFVVLPHDGAAATPELLAIRQAAEARLFAAGGVVDLCPIVQGASRYAWSSAYSDDGIHPNVAGRNKLRAEAPDVIFAAIRKVLP